MSTIEFSTREQEPINPADFVDALGKAAGNSQIELFVGATELPAETTFDS